MEGGGRGVHTQQVKQWCVGGKTPNLEFIGQKQSQIKFKKEKKLLDLIN